jgi:hypothetical protein
MADDVTDNAPVVTAPDPNDPNNPNSLLNPNNPNSVFNINNPANPNYVPPPMQVSQGLPDPNNPAPLQNTGTDTNNLLGMPTSVLPIQNQTQEDIQIKEQQDELFAAVKRGDRVRVEELVAQGADVMRPDSSGTTAIMDAVAGNDSGISREFLQQKANGNIGYDPLADSNLTGGMSLTDPLNPLNPLNALGLQPSATDAQALGVTAEEAAAMGNYGLAAQLAAAQSLADEERAANEGTGSDPDYDGGMTYNASVFDSGDGDYGVNADSGYNGYGGYGNNGYGNNADYYGDGYGGYGDEGYGDPTYGDPSYAGAYGTTDGTTTAPTSDPLLGTIGTALGTLAAVDTLAYMDNNGLFGTTSTNTLGLTDPTLSALGTNTFGITDPTATTNPYSSFLGSLNLDGTPSLSTDLGLLYGGTTGTSLTGTSLTGTSLTGTSPTGTSPTGTSSTDPLSSPTNSSMFFNFSSPTLSTGNNSIWSTNFFDPSSISSPTTTASTSPTITAPSIPPTNPAYRASAPAGP